MIFYQRFFPLLLLISLVLMGCIDAIDLNLESDQKKISVDGFIADSLAPYTINLAYSAVIGEGNDNIFEPISNATVNVKDDQGKVVGFDEEDKGSYTAVMKGETGRTYQLEIVLEDGKTINSKPQVLPMRAELGSVDYEIITHEYLNSSNNLVKDQSLSVNLNTDLDGSLPRPFLRWRLTGEYEFHEAYPMALSTKWCYVPEVLDFNQLRILDTRDVNGLKLKGFPILETDLNYRFAWQYCFHIFQLSMTEEEFNYWHNIEAIINRDGSLFDPPPGTVRGNLFNPSDGDEEILGYFSVSAVSYKRFFANTDILDVYIAGKCSFNGRRPQYAECRDCLNIYQSTLSKPAYWIP